MLQLAIPIPNIKGRQDIEIETTINGNRHKMRFRVEVYHWTECRQITENRITCIRDLVHDYENEWMIYAIGSPTEEYVPLTFVKTEDWLAQRAWIQQSIQAL